MRRARDRRFPDRRGAGVADAHRVVLEASDGNPLNAFSARALDPNAPG